MLTCQQCGMVLQDPAEFHPFAACLMFAGCKDGETVRSNLAFVVEHGGKDTLALVRDLNALVVKAQEALAAGMPPDADDHETITNLCGVLDGPEQREVQARANHALAMGKKP